MNGPRNDDAMAVALAEAMRAEVGTVVPPPSLVTGLPVRAARRRRARLTVVGVAASVAVVAAAVSVATAPAPSRPVGLPSPTVSPSPEPPVVPAPRMEAATLPPGFMYWHTRHVSTAPHDGSIVWPLVVTYARGFTYAGLPRTPIEVATTVDAIDEIDPGDFDDPGARWAVVGSRRVLRADRGYHWTEKQGVNVSVTARSGVTDAELRQVIGAVRLVTPSADRLTPVDDHLGVLLRETRGSGSRTIGPIAVSAEFDVRTLCDGTDLRVEIGSLRDGTWGCDGGVATQTVDRTHGVRSVTITLTADASTSWAILVTTSDGPPRG